MKLTVLGERVLGIFLTLLLVTDDPTTELVYRGTHGSHSRAHPACVLWPVPCGYVEMWNVVHAGPGAGGAGPSMGVGTDRPSHDGMRGELRSEGTAARGVLDAVVFIHVKIKSPSLRTAQKRRNLSLGLSGARTALALLPIGICPLLPPAVK